MSKILIVTPLWPPQIGGPATYAVNLVREFKAAGCEVGWEHLTAWERRLPTGIRHLVFGLRLGLSGRRFDTWLILDTFSVALPAVMAARLLGKKTAIRIGGDFLWESYCERTGQEISLPDFYQVTKDLNWKERLIFRLTRWLLSCADKLIFSCDWQRQIWIHPYRLSLSRTLVCANQLSVMPDMHPFSSQNFLWAGRLIKLKNLPRLRRAFEQLKNQYPKLELDILQLPKAELEKRLAACYAVILPSFSEVTPNLILEAISFGKPFILTKYSGLDDELAGIGLRVDPFSDQDLVAQVTKLLTKEEYDRQLGLIRNFSARRTWPTVASEYLSILEAL